MSTPLQAPFVSVVVPCRNEARYIGACLDSILGNDYPHDRLEVLVVDGDSDDGTRAALEAYDTRGGTVRVLDNPRRITPAALNIGIRAACGEIVLRMDAHVTYPRDYIRTLVAALEESGADNVGGVIRTLPADDRPMTRAIALGLSHPFGVGNSYFRIGSARRRWVDGLAFGCFRRSLFDRLGLFDEELVRNQDDEFNFRLREHGGRILLLPEVVASYHARGSLRQLARMFHQYGYFKPLVARKVGRVATWRQLVPALFVLALALSALASPWWTPARVALVALVVAYAAPALACAAAEAPRHGVRVAAALMAVFPVMHLSYGAGFLRGVLGPGVLRGTARPDAAVALSR